tara:strand:- start:560 stop:874 length:315 start_codon:yes stop_codon:yes gene_type:complete
MSIQIMPAVTRKGDQDLIHCDIPYREGASTNVFANGEGISREGDLNSPHGTPALLCGPHQAPITLGSTTVFVNGKGCGRVGDLITLCTIVAQGSPNVNAGPPII